MQTEIVKSPWVDIVAGDPIIKALSSKIIKRACGTEVLCNDILNTLFASFEGGFLVPANPDLFKALMAGWEERLAELKK